MIKLYKTSFMLSLSVIIIGAIFKIQHWPGAEILLSIGLLINLIYIIIGLIEVYKTNDKPFIEKLFWLLGFIMTPWIIAVIYYFIELKPKQNNSSRKDAKYS